MFNVYEFLLDIRVSIKLLGMFKGFKIQLLHYRAVQRGVR